METLRICPKEKILTKTGGSPFDSLDISQIKVKLLIFFYPLFLNIHFLFECISI